MPIISLHLGTSNKNLETIKIFSKERNKDIKKKQTFFQDFSEKLCVLTLIPF